MKIFSLFPLFAIKYYKNLLENIRELEFLSLEFLRNTYNDKNN